MCYNVNIQIKQLEGENRMNEERFTQGEKVIYHNIRNAVDKNLISDNEGALLLCMYVDVTVEESLQEFGLKDGIMDNGDSHGE